MKTQWTDLRDLRIKILKVSDEIQEVSISLREKNVTSKEAKKLNDIQIELGELLGDLMSIQTNLKLE